MTDITAAAPRSQAIAHVPQFVAMIEKFRDLDPTNFKAVLDIYRDEQDRQALAEFNTSYAAMLTEVGRVAKNKNNPLYKSRYASYEAMMDAIEPIKTKHGIGIYFGIEPTGNAETMRPYLELFKGMHRRRVCEQDIRISVEGPKGGRPAMNEMQALGSATTYIRKTFLQMAFNLVPSDDTDDDGNTAPAQQQQRGDRIYRQTDATRLVEQAGSVDPNRARIDQFLGDFKARAKATATQEAADTLIKDQRIMEGSDWLNRNSKTDFEEFCRIRDEMIARVFA